MAMSRKAWLFAILLAVATGEMLHNAGFESLDHWRCLNAHCSTSEDSHSGRYSLKITSSHGQRVCSRKHVSDGPSQVLKVVSGHGYHAEAWVKMLNDHSGQEIQIEVDFRFVDGKHEYLTVAHHSNARTSESWVHLQGNFVVPTNKAIHELRFYVQSGPAPSVSFLVDAASVTPTDGSGGHVNRARLNHVIRQQRTSPIIIHATTTAGVNKSDVRIHVLQKKKSFPFGTAVNSWEYNRDAAGGKYRDFIHKHFNWIVPESAMKWMNIEKQKGQRNYQLVLDMIHSVRSHGIRVRGHNLVWSVPEMVQGWVKQLQGDDLRNTVKNYVEEVINKTRGLTSHWDVNNENLHGTWYQDALRDPSYNLELFRIANRADPAVKLFLNDYNVVAFGSDTARYLDQALQFKKANVGLYGIGVQCHFANEREPNPTVIKHRLDTLAQVGLPIWVTELDVQAQDENRRADFYEKALTAVYGHPAVEGILIWGFWDRAHRKGEKAALVKGEHFQMTAAGRRVLDLYENQWMTDKFLTLPQSGNQVTLRGFHGDYEVHVLYQGREVSDLSLNFTVYKGSTTVVNINVHV